MNKSYHYKADRDIVMLVIHSLLWTIIFYIAWFGVRKLFDDVNSMHGIITAIHAAYWILFVICVVGSIISIFSKTKKCLHVTEDEIIYTYGLLSKYKVSVPLSKVRSCGISASITQRFFGTSNLSVCTAGDADEIYFIDIKDGNEAHKLIMNLIK